MSAGCAPVSAKAPAPEVETPEGPSSKSEKGYASRVREARHSLGPVALGLTDGEVVQALGEPAQKSGGMEEEATGLRISVWSYPELGLELYLGRGDEAGPATLERMTAAAPCKFITNRGIALGATRAQVDAAYAADYSKEEPSEEGRVVVDSIYDGLIFSFEGGKVTSMFFGAAAE